MDLIKLILEAGKQFGITLLLATIVGVIINDILVIGATKLGILGIGYLAVAISGCMVKVRRKYLFLKMIKELGTKTMDLEGLKDYLKSKQKKDK
jgi:ABC-type bacteriocin/lantibiotic exporter with double-glycine peptidase domain